MKSFVLCLVLAPSMLYCQQGGIAMPSPPPLPLVTKLPAGKGWVPAKATTRKSTVVFDTWRSERRRIGTLPAKTPIVLLEELNIVYVPDEVTVSSPITK